MPILTREQMLELLNSSNFAIHEDGEEYTGIYLEDLFEVMQAAALDAASRITIGIEGVGTLTAAELLDRSEGADSPGSLRVAVALKVMEYTGRFACFTSKHIARDLGAPCRKVGVHLRDLFDSGEMTYNIGGATMRPSTTTRQSAQGYQYLVYGPSAEALEAFDSSLEDEPTPLNLKPGELGGVFAGTLDPRRPQAPPRAPFDLSQPDEDGLTTPSVVRPSTTPAPLNPDPNGL